MNNAFAAVQFIVGKFLCSLFLIRFLFSRTHRPTVLRLPRNTRIQLGHNQQRWLEKQVSYLNCSLYGSDLSYICCTHAARLMAKRGEGGVIVNVSSTGGANYFLGVAYGKCLWFVN